MFPGLPGRYSVLRKIAAGGMAEVYLCRLRGEEGFEKNVAVKVVRPRLSENPRFRDLFVREARIAASLSHQNLIQVFDFGRQGTSFYLAMEFVDGWDLARTLAQMRDRAMPVPLPVWKYWMVGILDGISYLHSRDVIHRDISPGNVLVSRGGAVKITDFGVAWRMRREETGPSERGGKYSYMSPEQAGGEEADRSSDLFSAAVVAAEFFLPGRLFPGDGPEEVLKRLRDHDSEGIPASRFPPQVREVLRTGLAKRKADRFPDADCFARELSDAVPQTVSRPELVAFWDQLFPESLRGEEETSIGEGSASRAAAAGRIREKRAPYGFDRRRGVRIGIAASLATVSAAGILFWKGSAPRLPEAGTAVPAPGMAGSPRPGDAGDPGPPVQLSPEDGAGSATGPSARPEEPAGPAAVPPVRVREKDRSPGNAGSSDKVAAVWIETDPGGVSVINEKGILLGATPLLLSSTPLGGGKVLFRKEGYRAASVPSSALLQVPRFRMVMERETGTLEVVQAVPWARVYENGRFLGITPIASLELPAGEHRLRFVNEPLGVEREETVVVRPGRNPKLIVPLVRSR